FACLRAVRLVRDDHDVVALAVRLADRLIELMDQAENEPVVLAQQRSQLVPRACPRRLLVAYPATYERPPDLVVEVFAVGHYDEREVTGNHASYLLREERHRVGLAAALRVPEDAEASQVWMGPLD